MKRIRAIIQITLCVCAVLGWWGVLYPELVLTADTYRICGENESRGKNKKDDQEASAEKDIYWSLLEADTEEILFRSRLLEEWNNFMEALNESDQNGAALQGSAHRGF